MSTVHSCWPDIYHYSILYREYIARLDAFLVLSLYLDGPSLLDQVREIIDNFFRVINVRVILSVM
jgi:hypothetical protein